MSSSLGIYRKIFGENLSSIKKLFKILDQKIVLLKGFTISNYIQSSSELILMEH